MNNRKNTFDLLVALDNMLIDEDFVLSDALKMFIFNPFYTESKINNNNFRCSYLKTFRRIPDLLKNKKYYWIEWTRYFHTYKMAKPKERKILWLMYEYYLDWWFKTVKDISYENIWLRQIYENNFHNINLNISIKDTLKWKELKKFIIPNIFIESNKIYEVI